MPKNNQSAVKWIYQVAGPGKRWVIFLALVRIFQGLLALGYAFVLKETVNTAVAGQGQAFLGKLIMLGCLVAVTVGVQALGRYLQEKAHTQMDKVFRLRLFQQLLNRDYAQISKVHTGRWMNRLYGDTQAVSSALIRIFPELAGMLVRIGGAFLVMAGIVPALAWLLLPACGCLAVVSSLLKKKMKVHHRAVQEADGIARSFFQERLSGLTVVHTFTQEEASQNQGKQALDAWSKARMMKNRFSNLGSTALSGAMHLAELFGVGACCWGIVQGSLSYGTMSAVMYLVGLLTAPFTQLAGALSQYYAMLASAERLMEVEALALDAPVKPMSQQAAGEFYRQSFSSLALENATFHYEEAGSADVLENVSLTLEKGEFLAFTGPSGCGKSTVMKLLLSLYPLSGGNAWIVTKQGQKLPLDSRYRSLFAYVPQGNLLLSGTIRESLSFFNQAVMEQEEKIWQALEIACCKEFVRELPLGLDSPLGEGGSGLSEGQLQRLSIARALLSERPILLLDEVTSALDGATEEQLLKNLKAMTDRTVVLITHREAAADSCHRKIEFTADTLS